MWFVYIISCSDGTLYTGSTNNIEKRLQKHNKGDGAKYTRSRLPVSLICFLEFDNKSSAMSFEYYLKQKTREQKMDFIKSLESKDKV